MGKKRIIKRTEEEVLKEREKIEEKMRKETKVGKEQRVGMGRVYIASSYNNTLMTLTNMKGDVLLWKSAGNIGFKGTKKATPFAASKVAEAFIDGLRKLGVESVEVLIKGIGSGRESALRSLAARGVDIVSIKDVTPMPHNGCRPCKARRV